MSVPRHRRTAAAGLSVLSALAVTVVGPAGAAHALVGELGVTRYNLHQGTEERWYLTCDPDGGSHPAAEQACDRLRQIGGDLEELRMRPDAPCPHIYDPVHLEITGVWHGVVKVFRETYPNSCHLERIAVPVAPGQG